MIFIVLLVGRVRIRP